MKPKDPDALVELCKASSESEAAIIVAVLRDEGIPATAQNHGADVFGGAMDLIVPRRVQVRRADLHDARTFLEANSDLAETIDWDDVDWAAVDHPDRETLDVPPVTTSIDKGLLIKIGAAVMIVVIVLFLITTALQSGSTDGIVPTAP